MFSAPTTAAGWLSFAGSVVALYVVLVSLLTDADPFGSLVTGAFYGLSVATVVALLVVLWRGIPDLLYTDSGETTERR